MGVDDRSGWTDGRGRAAMRSGSPCLTNTVSRDAAFGEMEARVG